MLVRYKEKYRCFLSRCSNRRFLRSVSVSALLSLFITCVLIFPCIPVASAEEGNSIDNFPISYWCELTNINGMRSWDGSSDPTNSTLPYSGSLDSYMSGARGIRLGGVRAGYFASPSSSPITYFTDGDVGLYVSFRLGIGGSPNSADIKQVGTPRYFGFYHTPNGGQTGHAVESFSITQFGNLDSNSGTIVYLPSGWTLSSRQRATQIDPVCGMSINSDEGKAFGVVNTRNSLTSSRRGFVNITSARLVGFATSDVGNSIENLANSIAEQNQIMSAYMGDVISVCNAIYERLGDMQATAEIANVYFASMADTLQNIYSTLQRSNQYLSSIDNRLDLINSQITAQTDRLLAQLQQSTVDVTTAVSDAEQALELYLQPMIDYILSLQDVTGEDSTSLQQHSADINNSATDSGGLSDEDTLSGLYIVYSILSEFSFVLLALSIWLGCSLFFIIVRKGLS